MYTSVICTLYFFSPLSPDSLKRNRATISDAMLKDLQKRCPNLHVLHLNHCNNDNLCVTSLPSSLTSLSITHSTWQPRWLKGNKDLLPHLVSLDFSSTTRIDNFDLMDISELSSLSHLSVSDCYRIKGTGFEVIAKNLSNLKSLNLSSTEVDELAIHHIARQCKQMEEFFLCKCRNVTNSCLAEIAAGLRGLIILDLSECPSVTVSGIRTLSSLNKLRTLIIQRFKTLTEADIDEVKDVFVQEDIDIVL